MKKIKEKFIALKKNLKHDRFAFLKKKVSYRNIVNQF